MMIQRSLFPAFALAAIALAGTSPLSAETTQCTAITSIPFTISSGGVYCLTANLTNTTLSGAAITINANFVTLDLNGHLLSGPIEASTPAIGIYAVSRGGLIVRNGTIRGFQRAIVFQGCGSSIIEDVSINRSRLFGIEFDCTGCVARHNYVYLTGGASTGVPAGIVARGVGNAIRDNEVVTLRSSSGSVYSYGIAASPSDNTVIEGNRITDAHTGVQVAPVSQPFDRALVFRAELLLQAFRTTLAGQAHPDKSYDDQEDDSTKNDHGRVGCVHFTPACLQHVQALASGAQGEPLLLIAIH